MTDIAEASRPSLNVSQILQRYGTVAILVALVIVAASMSNVFLTERNILNVLRQISGTSMMAVGMLFVILTRGIALIVSAGQPIVMGDSGASIAAFGAGSFLTIPYPIILMVAVFLIAGTVLTFTRYGRLVKAIGSNIEAVRLSGIPVAGYIMSVYVISGILAAAAGIISASRTGVGSANIGVGAELDAIAAVVIGGASLMGGRGGAFNTFIGVIVLGIIANMMNLARVPGYHQQVFMGCIIIGAMLLQYASNWLRR